MKKNIIISENKVSVCHNNNCLNIKGENAKIVTFGIALFLVVSGISTLLEASK
ncbi:hypothetical protein ACXIHB_10265 [Tenacibaculum sp. IMCC1]